MNGVMGGVMFGIAFNELSLNGVHIVDKDLQFVHNLFLTFFYLIGMKNFFQTIFV
jgi:hypothetical protein